MSFQRSKSAPHFIDTISTLHIPRSSSHENVQRKPRRPAPLLPPVLLPTASPLLSPSSRSERDDPFSLTTFFPASRISEEGEGWHWLRDAEEEADSILAVESPVEYEDEPAGEVIKSEDKMGVLSLKPPSVEPYPRLLSPYSNNDVVDADSLHLALLARRRARNSVVEANPSFGELFLQTERTEETDSLKTFFDGFRQFLD